MFSGKIVGYLYVTDVCPRFEEEDFDADSVYRRYHETLLHKIPLYAEIEKLVEWGKIPQTTYVDP